MRGFSFFSFLGALAFAGLWLSAPTGCANIIPPSGGPRDSTAPRLLSAVPKDSTLNFRGDRIVFTFDEFIDDPQDISNNLLFTPTFEVNPEIAIRGKNMTLRFRDSLLPNTTYILNFGNALRDINENNVLRNFTYTFSTGPVLDSLSFSGRVVSAQTGRPDSTLLVLLHRNLTDSAVVKERPVYIAKLDGGGNFRFQNLPKGNFAVYALGDAGFSRRYQTKLQLFAFSDSTVRTGETREVTLYAYREAPPASTINPILSAPGAARGGTSADRRLRFTPSPSSGTLDLQKEYSLTFPAPLRTFDSTKVSLTADSLFTPVRYSVQLDSSRTVLRFRSAWLEGIRYNLVLNRDFAEDSAGRKLLKTDTLNFTTKKRSDYGAVNLRIRNATAGRNPVLLFLQGETVVFSTPISSGTFRSTLFVPGEYELRLLYDANGNGVWDPGKFFGGRRQPERVQPIDRRITVKPAWDNEFDISL